MTFLSPLSFMCASISTSSSPLFLPLIPLIGRWLKRNVWCNGLQCELLFGTLSCVLISDQIDNGQFRTQKLTFHLQSLLLWTRGPTPSFEGCVVTSDKSCVHMSELLLY